MAQVAWAESIAVKPTSPIHVSIHPESVVSPGSIVSFVVQVTSSLPSDNLIIDIDLPQGAELVSGELYWRGTIYQEEICNLHKING